VGPHNVAAPTLASLGTNFGLAPLIGKPVAIVSDARLGRGSRDQGVITERMLSISGEDSLTIDRKYKEPWTGRLPARFMVLTNELPELTDSSGALASRFVVLLTRRSFYGHEDTALTDKLLTELPSIFLWALDGYQRLLQRGWFQQPKASLDAIQELEDLSSPIGAFLRDRCKVEAGLTVTVQAMWDAWKIWCEDHGRKPGSRQVFGRNLRAAVPGLRVARPRDDGERYRAYEGVALAKTTMDRTADHSGPEAVVHDGPRSNALLSQEEMPF
jgi:putative DNA primase/helicase